MKKLFLISMYLIFISITVNAQQENKNTEKKQSTNTQKKSRFWDNVRFGGGLGLDFSNGGTSISITPTAIYNINNYLSAGVSTGYQYSSRNDFSSNIFSLGVLTLFNPIKNLQFSAEFEQLFINQKFNNSNSNRKVPAFYLGGAYRLGRNFSAGIRYDVLYNKDKSAYSSAFSPIVRVFF